MYVHRLSDTAQQLLRLMHQRYLLARAEGAGDTRARIMPDDAAMQSEWFPQLTTSQIQALCRELEQAGFLIINYASGIFYDCSLTAEGVTDASDLPAPHEQQAADNGSPQSADQRTEKPGKKERTRLSEAWKIAIFSVIGAGIFSVIATLIGSLFS